MKKLSPESLEFAANASIGIIGGFLGSEIFSFTIRNKMTSDAEIIIAATLGALAGIAAVKEKQTKHLKYPKKDSNLFSLEDDGLPFQDDETR